MSAVFKVSHRVTHKLFALKWMLPSLRYEQDAVQRFILEAQVAGRVDHPNVVEVYDVGEQDDSLYMVMEFLQGESLASKLAHGPLTPAEACAVLVPTARGLSAVHAAGVIHRDLKPQNIFLARNPDQSLTPKVLDFGISKVSQLHGEPSAAITREGMIIGTPHYMAPEQVLGKQVDERTDVYGLGVILYEALTGELPFTGGSYGDLAIKITTEVPRSIADLAPDTPRALVEVVSRAMAREPAQRFASAHAFAEALAQYAARTQADAPLAYSPTRPALSKSEPPTPLSTESRQLPAAIARHPRASLVGVAVVVCASIAVSIGLSIRRNTVESTQPLAPAPAQVTTPETSVSTALQVEAPSKPVPETGAGMSPQPAAAPEPATLRSEPAPVLAKPPTIRAMPTRQASEPRPKPSARLQDAPPAPLPPPAAEPARRSTRRTQTLTEADF